MRALLARLRLDDLLALGAILTFGILSAWTSASLLSPSVLNFAALLGTYGLLALLGLALTGPGPAPWARRGLLAGATLLLFLFTVALPDGGASIDGARNFVVLAFPLAAVALLPAGPGGALSRGLGFARDWAPYLVSGALYLSLHDVVSQVSPVDRDAWLIRADLALFGGHASVWLEGLARPWLTEWMSATYALYVFFPLTLGLTLQIRGDRRRFLHLLQACILVSWLGFLGYVLVPAVGPMYTLAGLYQAPLQGGPLYQIKEGLDALRIPRDCFPSLHTAHTLVVLIGAFSHRRRLGLVYLPLCVSCIAATLYLRYHYAVDVLAGGLLALFALWVTPHLDRAWRGLTQGDGARAA